ncbi:DEAD/DEAH box helicase [Verrucomicrobium spinosum]|uniref:DEAD/DEAH box helicase n=2 Tax=Verrucomicrobium spinosum TaxID=2736 RepID=UPI0002D31F08|nr:DEAD/DEAH box helicase [Verrucomicrobium spinosum]
MSQSTKTKPSLLQRITSGLKRLTGLGKKKTADDSAKHHEKHPEKLHAAKAATRRDAAEHRPKVERERDRDGNRGRDRDRQREGGGAGAGRPPRTGERDRERPRSGRDGDRRQGRGGRERDRDRAPREEREAGDRRHAPAVAAVPPPPAPPVPEGPYPEAFEILGLSPAVLSGVRDMGYEKPTEIQARTAPVVLAGKDVIGASQTGTGKTAAFGLPTLSRLGAPGKLRCLILEPTRELAAQVVEAFDKFNRHTGLRTLLVHGGVGYGKQREGLQRGVDIVVATPGRLLDFMSDGTVNLADIEVLILDEVDRMLDMGFLPDVRRIVSETPKSRQTLFFSATMPPQIKGLAEWALREPESIEVGLRFSPAETVSHYMYPVASDQREELLLALLQSTEFHSVMIFTRMKVHADRLFAAIQQTGKYKVAVMHSDINQRDREKALQGFRDGAFDIIVATDLAARGLDVSGVTHVINYMVPENPEDYVHRIGRTGRAQKEGDAFTLFAADEISYVHSIERLIDQKIERRKLDGFKYKFTTVLDNEDKAKAIMTGRKTAKRRR